MVFRPRAHLSLAFCVALLPNLVPAGIQPFNLLLPPTDAFVHYNDGYIRAPGFIDLGDLTFTAVSDGFEMDDNFLADDKLGDDGAVFAGDDGDDGGAMRDRDDDSAGDDGRRQLDGGVEKDSTAVDIAIFHLPRRCMHSRKGCDWAELGVGKRSEDGSLRWCCTSEAIELGLCEKDDKNYGRLMIGDNFTGNHRFVNVPKDGNMAKQIRFGKMEEKESGTYVVMYANCNEFGREIYVTGDSVWKSKHGFLPGELFGFMFFYMIVTIVYFSLMVWYGVCMFVNEEHRIEIEKWVFLAISIGLLEMLFRTGDYFVWNQDGYRSTFVIWIGVLGGVVKQGVSRCLIVMVSLGWGVVRDSLGSTMRTIVVLGALYIGVSSVRDLMIVFAIEDVNKLSSSEETEIFDVVKFLTLAVSALDVIFIMWILDALNNTMMYLENMKQGRKLERYLKLRCYFLFSILFATVWAVFTLVDTVNQDGIVAEEHAWAIDAATEVNYLFVLISVATLWRPNPNAKEYAYAMELPAMGEENEIELGGAVPSAMDADDGEYGESDKQTNEYQDDSDDRFQIS